MLFVLSVLLYGVSGCASRGRAGLAAPDIRRDSLAITNETKWVYAVDPATGGMRHEPRTPPPTYSLRCFALSRTVKQFHAHATFVPGEPVADEATYRRLVRDVVRKSPRSVSPPDERIEIPGYDGLNRFSAAWPALFQQECGGVWSSYVQRGHWRMVFPFGRRSQEREAGALLEGVREWRLPAVHLVDFPRLRMNHAVVLFDATETESEIGFVTYDPNSPGSSVTLTFDKVRRRFVMQPVAYFPGGDVSVYEVYCNGAR